MLQKLMETNEMFADRVAIDALKKSLTNARNTQEILYNKSIEEKIQSIYNTRGGESKMRAGIYQLVYLVSYNNIQL